MRYIDKSVNKAEGLALTKDFMDRHCMTATGRHAGIRYRDDDRNNLHTFCAADDGKYRRAMVNLLMMPQNSLCCYCLRKLKTHQNSDISDQTITIEHIIPDSYTSSDDVAYYRSAPNLSPGDVEITDVYENPAYPQSAGIHPHKVAFNNFVLSCKGTFPDIRSRRGGKSAICCNEKRGNSEAYPVYFLPDVADYVDYLRNGDIQAVVGKTEESHVKVLIDSTNLQCDSLKDIRFLWYILRGKDLKEIAECNSNDNRRNYLLCEILFDGSIPMDRATVLFSKFIEDDSWDTFMLYHTFHDIMRSKYGM